MSYDQKPSRIKLVSGGGQTPVPAPTAPVGGQPAGDAAAGQTPKRRSGVMVAVLFLIGSALGGAGLAAWPHIAG